MSVLGGWTMQYQRDESNYAFANGFIINSIPTLNAGTVTRGNSNASEWSLLSALARIQYNYLGKYMITGALRADGASRFGKIIVGDISLPFLLDGVFQKKNL